MRYVLAILLALFLLTSAQAQPFALEWQSTLPVDPASIEATTTSGTIIGILITEDKLQGWVYVDAPRACLTIAMTGQTTAGVLVQASRSWSDGCDRLYLPMVLR